MDWTQKSHKKAIWTRELRAVLMEGLEDNDKGWLLAHDRLKLLHPLPLGKRRYSSDFEKWLKKVSENDPASGAPLWLTAKFWQNEVDRVLVEEIFGNVPKDEAAGRIRAAWPELSVAWLNDRMEEVARSGLPRWMDGTFWATEVDPILQAGIRNANQCQYVAVEAARQEFLELRAIDIWNRLVRLRGRRSEDFQNTSAVGNSTHVTSQKDQLTAVDAILHGGIREAKRCERESVRRALNKFPELRIGAVWTRLGRLRRQSREEGHTGVPFPWTADLDDRLRQAHQESGLCAAVNEVQNITGWPRNAIYRRARKLGLPHKAVGSRRRWTMVEFRFALESVGHMSMKDIAEEIGRSEKAVREMVAQRGIESRFQDGYSLRELAEKLHVRRTNIRTWIKSGLLRRKKNGRISEDSLQSFLHNHPERINWSLLDEDTTLWISELLEAEKIRAAGSRTQTPASSRSSDGSRAAEASMLDGTASSKPEADPCEGPVSHNSRARGASPRQ